MKKKLKARQSDNIAEPNRIMYRIYSTAVLLCIRIIKPKFRMNCYTSISVVARPACNIMYINAHS